MKDAKMEELIGQTIVEIEGAIGRSEMVFTLADGRKMHMFHDQDCCESVNIEDINGDLQDLIGSPVLMAEEATSKTNPEGVTKDYQDSFTWTFYKLATVKGYVTIRWYGESNGYYSEAVEMEWM